jgi:hypothetical protein
VIVKLSCCLPGFGVERHGESPPSYTYLPGFISHAVWLYHPFRLSFSGIEMFLAGRCLHDVILAYQVAHCLAWQ